MWLWVLLLAARLLSSFADFRFCASSFSPRCGFSLTTQKVSTSQKMGIKIREYPKAPDRFWLKVEKTNGCWIWTGCKANGYGIVGIAYETWFAHRVAWVSKNGQLSSDLQLDHLCRDRACVNPDHLDPVPQAVNMIRGDGWGGVNSRKTHCPQGHEYTDRNTYVIPSTNGRMCRICKASGRASEQARANERKALNLGPGKPGRPSGYSN